MIVGQQIERHGGIFASSSSSVGASAAAGMSSQCPVQTDASLSHAAEIVKITGLAILSLLLPENTPPGDEYKDGRVMTAAFPSHAASTCSGSRSIRPAPPPSAATGTCRCGALDDLPARLAELYFRLARR